MRDNADDDVDGFILLSHLATTVTRQNRDRQKRDRQNRDRQKRDRQNLERQNRDKLTLVVDNVGSCVKSSQILHVLARIILEDSPEILDLH